MPPVLQIKSGFLVSTGECRALYRHCLAPRGPHTDAGVEAAFLQMFKGWENLLEECTLAFLCQRLRCDGRSVPSYSTSVSEQFARKALLQDRPFIEWTDVDRNIKRWESLFQPPSLLEGALRPAKPELGQMATIRNAIAHSSQISEVRFRVLVQGEFGGIRRFKRPAELLSSAWVKDPTRTYFDRYADVLETITPLLTG